MRSVNNPRKLTFAEDFFRWRNKTDNLRQRWNSIYASVERSLMTSFDILDNLIAPKESLVSHVWLLVALCMNFWWQRYPSKTSNHKLLLLITIQSLHNWLLCQFKTIRYSKLYNLSGNNLMLRLKNTSYK